MFRRTLAPALLGLIFLARSVAAPADDDWVAVQAAMRAEPPARDSVPAAEFQAWMRESAQKLHDTGWRFLDRYPEDPRRWELVVAMLQLSSPATPEATARAARLEAMRIAASTAPDASASTRERAAAYPLMRRVMGGTPIPLDQLEPLQVELDALAAQFPEGRFVAMLQRGLLRSWEHAGAERFAGILQRLENSPNREIRSGLAGRRELERARREPMTIKFTALDGREVDLAALRGKVVLVDFWATWCKPCIAEIPHMKKVYAAYHARGFEIIGITLDQQRDEQKLKDLIATHEIPWPQYFDGKGARNQFTDPLGIRAIPAMLLLDQRGLLVSDNARGEKLEAEVKRLLGL